MRSLPIRLLALSLCAMTACVGTWQAQPAPPAELLATTPKQVRLTLADGTQHTMNLARIEGDSVVGVRPRPNRTGRNAMAYALADVRRIEVLAFSPRRAWMIVGGIAAILLICAATGCMDELKG